MLDFIDLALARRVLEARGWSWQESNARETIFTAGEGRRAVIRHAPGDPTRALAEDLVLHMRGVQFAMAEGGAPVVMADGGGGLAVAEVEFEAGFPEPVGVASLAEDHGGGGGGPDRSPCVRLEISPGRTDRIGVEEVLEAISELHRCLGGEGIDFKRTDAPGNPDGGWR